MLVPSVPGWVRQDDPENYCRKRGQEEETISPPRFVRQTDPSYDRHVTEQAQAVLVAALRLTVKERAELAAELLASLDGGPDKDVEAAWAAEIESRVRRLEVEGSRGRSRQEVFGGLSR